MSHPVTDDRKPVHTPAGLIAFAWTLVGVPLAYGLYQTVKAASALFGG
ncbi:MFS transporter small subunit [Geodermatophilus sp. URMC 61]